MLDLANEYTGFEAKRKCQISTEYRGISLWYHHYGRLRQKDPKSEPTWANWRLNKTSPQNKIVAGGGGRLL